MGSSTRKIVVSGLIVSFMLCGLLTLGVQAQEKVVLRYADTTYGPTLTKSQKNWIESFMIRYPNIEVREERLAWEDFHDKYLIQAAGHTLPDIIYLYGGWVSKWIKTGLVMDLIPYIEENEALADISDYFPRALELYRYKGGLYGLPMDTGPEGWNVYNIDLFKKAGLEPPKESWTFEGEFLEATKKLTKDTDADGEIDQWGIGGIWPQNFYTGYIPGPSMLMPWGGRFINEEETKCLITEPGSIKALEFWMGLLRKYRVAIPYEKSKALESNAFHLGKVGIGYGAPWVTHTLERFKDLNWDVMPIPEGPAGRFVSIMGSCFSVTRDSKHPDEAWLFLRDYMSREGLTYVWALSGSGSCARRSAWMYWENRLKYPKSTYWFRWSMEYGVFARPLGGSFSEVYEVSSQELKNALLNPEISVEELANRIKQKVDSVLAKYAE